MALLDKSGRILDVNRKAVEMFGGLKEELLGKHFTKIGVISPRIIPVAISAFTKILAGKQITVSTCIKNKKGREIDVEVSASLMKTDGRPIGMLVIARDITERKKTEEKIKRASEEWARTFDAISDFVFIIDRDFRFVRVNKATCDFLKKEPEELLGKRCYEVAHGRNEPLPNCPCKKMAITKKSETTEINDPNLGLSFLMTVSPLFDENGEHVGCVHIAKDITERKKTEEALVESEEKYRCLFESANDALVYGDLTGRVLDVNKKAEDLAGIKREEILGKRFWKLGLVSLKDVPKLLGLLKRRVAEGKQTIGFELIITKKNGEKKFVEVNSAIVQKEKVPIGFLAIVRDVTERKAMEEKLRQYSESLEEVVQKRTEELLESEKRYSVLVEEAGDGVAILQDEKIVFSNKRLAEILGYPKDELIGLSIEKPVAEEYRQLVKERYQRRLQGEKVPTAYEVEALTKTGECIPIELNATSINYQRRPADLVIVRDIRERKQIEEQRLRLEKLATMGELATMVAHDLRNPLTSIRNAGFYIKNSCPGYAKPECKTAIEMLDIIEQETLFANNIINDLLDFAAKRSLQKNEQNINKIIEDSLTTSNIPENIKVERKFAEKATANVDDKQLERVLLNLIKNAVQAMPNGGKLTVTTSETKEHVEIGFTDTGLGIPDENLSKLFTPLFTTKAKGIGMGLAICKKIVEQHGGTIEARSKAGQGTTFTIKLPKKEEENAQ